MTTFCGILYLLNEIKVKNVIIGKQFEVSKNYEEFIKIVRDNNIKVNIVECNTKLTISNDLTFNVLWPNSKQRVLENSINNNSLILKLNYKDFSMLFTGDIEEEAEKILVSKYKNNNILKSTVLKVAHHGSKSSSIQEFLELVKPKVALIGVGKNNNFGHPNEKVLERLEILRYKNL